MSSIEKIPPSLKGLIVIKNPFNVDKDIDELVAELREANSDAKPVAKLYAKILAKGTTAGLAISASIAAVAVVTIGVIAIASNHEDTEN
jgi:hypothetical protein